MRILFVADGRSPIALNWIKYFIEKGYQVHLASSYPCKPELNLASLHILSQGFGATNRVPASPISSSKNRKGLAGLREVVPVNTRTWLRQWLAPLRLRQSSTTLNKLVEIIQPDLVHAMRIPFEGMLAAQAGLKTPLVISVWGNDFTLHARATPFLKRYTGSALLKADLLHTDCQRDLRLAYEWGYPSNRSVVVLPGAGGVKMDLFKKGLNFEIENTTHPGNLTIINPRGYRAYVRNDTFFKAIPAVRVQIPSVCFLCPSMAEESPAKHWVRDLNIADCVSLLPYQTPEQMASLFTQAHVSLSITTHDGTPNTLLEAMACGCFPIAGDIETVHEWIVPGENGILVPPQSPHALAEAILTSWENKDLRQKAAAYNRKLVAERADYQKVMASAETMYRNLI
jgi:glycosyltransferase involved in cell wall biosynthesis